MKRAVTKKLFCLLVIFGFFGLLSANAQSIEEEEVATAVEKFNQAMVEANKTALDTLTADKLSYGHSSGKIENKAEFVEAVVQGPFDFVTLDAAEQSIEVVGEIAIVRHIFLSKAMNGGNPVDIRIGNVLVWQKQNGQWKLLARQAFKI